MDELYSPVQYEDLDIEGLKSHFRYIAKISKNGHCAEIYLCGPKVAIPITKTTYKTKSDKIEFQLRSGSIHRKNLTKLNETLLKQSYKTKVAYTTKKKLIKRLSLPISIDDPMLPIIGVKILENVALQLKTKWPGNISIGYSLGDENNDLPGTLKYRDKFSQAGYKIGLAAGKVIKMVMP